MAGEFMKPYLALITAAFLSAAACSPAPTELSDTARQALHGEVAEQLDDPEKGVEWYTKLMQLAGSIDSTRKVTCALHPGYTESENEVPSITQPHRSTPENFRFRTGFPAAT